MPNLITEYEDDSDNRDAGNIVVPTFNSPPAPVAPQPQMPQGFQMPEADPEIMESMGTISGDPSIPMPENFSLDIPGSTPGEPTPEEMADGGEELVVPDYSPFQPQQSAVQDTLEQQEQKQQASFLSELDNNSLQFLTSGDVYPTLYEGAASSDLSQLNERALSQTTATFQQSKQTQTQQLTIPMAQTRVDMDKPWFNSTQNPLSKIPGAINSALNATGIDEFLGITDQSGEFNPGAGARSYIDAIKKDPWKIISLPIALPIMAAQSKWGEQGDGWWGGALYTLSIGDNIIAGAATDVLNIVSGNRSPKTNLPGVAQAVVGGNFDFTQSASAHRPLAFIGPKEAPRTITELQNRGGLSKLLMNPWTWEIVRQGKKLLTGNENITVPGVHIPVPGGGEGNDIKLSGGRALQTGEAITGFAADVAKGFFAGFGFGAIDNAFNSGKKVVQIVQGTDEAAGVITKIQPPASSVATTTPPVLNQGIGPSPVTQLMGDPPEAAIQITAPVVKLPTPQKTAAISVSIKPNTVAPKIPGVPVITPSQLLPSPDIDEVIKQIGQAPIGTTVSTEALVNVERSTEELTEVAKLLGDVPPTRTTPLSRNRLDELSKSYPDGLSPYSIHGTPIDVEAFRAGVKRMEIEPGRTAELGNSVPISPAIDMPTLPKDTQSIIPAIYQRKRMLEDMSLSPEIRQQAAHEIDKLYDNLIDTPDVTDVATLAEVSRNLPRSMHTASPEGTTLLQEMLTQQTIYEEAAEVENVLKPVYINSTKYLSENLDAIDTLPFVTRQSAMDAAPFTPSPIPEKDMGVLDELVDAFTPMPAVNNKPLYHGSQVRGLDLKSIEPLQGGSRNELGPGIYLSTNKEFAEDSAKAMPQRNLPPVQGREFDEVGSVYQVTPNVKNPIDAAAAPPQEVHQAFMESVRITQPPEILSSLKKKLGATPTKPFNTYYTALDEVLERKLGKVPEVDTLQTQRLINDSLRVAGYDAIDNGDIVVLLTGKSIDDVTNLGQVGTGAILEGYAARFNVAQRTAALYPKNKVLAVQAREAGAQLQTELTRHAGEQLDNAVNRAEDAATGLARTQDYLEEFVRKENIAKRERSHKIAEAQNKNQIQNDSLPDRNHCI